MVSAQHKDVNDEIAIKSCVFFGRWLRSDPESVYIH